MRGVPLAFCPHDNVLIIDSEGFEPTTPSLWFCTHEHNIDDFTFDILQAAFRLRRCLLMLRSAALQTSPDIINCNFYIWRMMELRISFAELHFAYVLEAFTRMLNSSVWRVQLAILRSSKSFFKRFVIKISSICSGSFSLSPFGLTL